MDSERWRGCQVMTRRLFRAARPLSLVEIVLCLAACAAAARTQMTGYISKPTDQLAVPGELAGAEITPEGDLYTGWAEYQPMFGRDLRSWYQPTRILPDPAVPLFQARRIDKHVLYTEEFFAIPVAGQPVAYMTLTAQNLGTGPELARVALQMGYSRGPLVTGFHHIVTARYRYERPAPHIADGLFEQPGEAFNPAWRYSVEGRDIVRVGLLLSRGPRAPAQLLPTANSSSYAAPHAKEAYQMRLAGGRSVSWTWQIPMRPPPAGGGVDRDLDAVPLKAAHAQLVSLWRDQEAGMTRIYVPEARVNAVYEANAVEMLASRYLTPSGWVEGSNKLQYQAYWIRDSAIETVALDLIGLHRPAAQNLAFLAHWQQPDGLYISRAGQQDGIGQALWELSEHAQLTGSAAFAAANLANVQAAVEWINRASASDRLGILPPSTLYDDEFASGGYVTGDSLWAATGLRSAARLAQLAGRSDLAAAWQAIDERYETALDQAIAQAAAPLGHIPPVLESTGGYDWGNYWAAYPLPILDPRSRLVTETVAWARAHFREGLATYANGATLHDYLGFPIFEAELDNGRVADALRGFYAELAHTTTPGYGWEDGPAPYGSREDYLNLEPHGTFAGQFVTMLRNMLVRDDGNAIDLLAGVSPAWMHAGDHMDITAAPTHYGNVSLRLTSAASGATLRWWSHVPAGTPLFWTVPYWVRQARTTRGMRVTRRLRLHTASGSVALKWSAQLPHLSYPEAVAELNRDYRAHSRAGPIVRAPGW